MQRLDQSDFLDKILSEMKKEASSFITRISLGIKKEDPFKEFATNDVWFVQGELLLRDNKKILRRK